MIANPSRSALVSPPTSISRRAAIVPRAVASSSSSSGLLSRNAESAAYSAVCPRDSAASVRPTSHVCRPCRPAAARATSRPGRRAGATAGARRRRRSARSAAPAGPSGSRRPPRRSRTGSGRAGRRPRRGRAGRRPRARLRASAAADLEHLARTPACTCAAGGRTAAGRSPRAGRRAAISTSWPATRSCRKKTTRRASPAESVPSTRRTARSSRAYVRSLSGVPNRSTRKPARCREARRARGGAPAAARRGCRRRSRRVIANASATPATTSTGRSGCARSLAAETPRRRPCCSCRRSPPKSLHRCRGYGARRGRTAGRSSARTASRPARARRPRSADSIRGSVSRFGWQPIPITRQTPSHRSWLRATSGSAERTCSRKRYCPPGLSTRRISAERRLLVADRAEQERARRRCRTSRPRTAGSRRAPSWRHLPAGLRRALLGPAEHPGHPVGDRQVAKRRRGSTGG